MKNSNPLKLRGVLDFQATIRSNLFLNTAEPLGIADGAQIASLVSRLAERSHAPEFATLPEGGATEQTLGLVDKQYVSLRKQFVLTRSFNREIRVELSLILPFAEKSADVHMRQTTATSPSFTQNK